MNENLDKKAFLEALDKVSDMEFVGWDKLKNKTVFVTGATGLVGFNVVSAIVTANRKRSLGVKVIALARSIDKARERFEAIEYTDEELSFVKGSVLEMPVIDSKIDYIIHGASVTASKDFVEKPVETIKTAVVGTMNILELAKEKKVVGCVYLSSMEVYGYPEKGHKVKEDEIGSILPLNVRNCYPVGKLQYESMCAAYASEYNLPIMIARLTQTFGFGTDKDDKRVVAEFAKCAREKKDIVLKTKGETERSYLHVSDAASALLTILINGDKGQAYNVADEDSYISIADLAEKVAKSSGIKVVYDLEDSAKTGYLNTLYMDLDTYKLRKLGWKAKFGFDY